MNIPSLAPFFPFPAPVSEVLSPATFPTSPYAIRRNMSSLFRSPLQWTNTLLRSSSVCSTLKGLLAATRAPFSLPEKMGVGVHCDDASFVWRGLFGAQGFLEDLQQDVSLSITVSASFSSISNAFSPPRRHLKHPLLGIFCLGGWK